MKSLFFNFAVVSSLLICARPTRGESQNQPVVISMTGTWFVEHSGAKKPVKSGDKVDERDFLFRVATEEFQSFGKITLMFAGAKTSTVSCDDPQSLPHSFSGCSDKIPVGFLEARAKSERNNTGEQEGAGFVASLMTRIQTLFNRPDSGEFFSADVRDVGTLEDAVLRKQGNAIDWTPAFRHLGKGEFLAQVGGTSPSKVKFSWAPPGSMVSEMNGLGKGLRKLHIETTDGEVVGDVWVLIEEPSEFDGKARQFAELKERTSAWGQDVSASGVEAVLRGGLTELAR